MRLTVYSYTNSANSGADTTVNDLSAFTSKILNNPILEIATPNYIQSGDGQEPVLAGVTIKGQILDISFNALQSPLGDGLDLIAALFNHLDTAVKTLVMKDADDSDRQWYLKVRNLGVTENKGKNCVAKVAVVSEILMTVATETESTWTASSLPATQAFTNDVGNIDALPIFDITSTGTGALGQRYCRFCTTYPYTKVGAVAYSLDVTNGGIDTSALINFSSVNLQVNGAVNAVVTTIAYDNPTGSLPAVPFLLYRGGEQMRVTAKTGTTSGNLTVVRGVYGSVATTHADNVFLALSKICFDGSDVRVLSGNGNGALTKIPFWFGTGANAFNTTVTKIWAPITYAARAYGVLSSAISSSDTSMIFDAATLNGSIDASDGIFLLESEIVTYTTYVAATRTTSDMIRGAKGTAAAGHAAGITVRALNDLWLYYGDPSAVAPTYAVDLKPPFALNSSNSSWVYNTFSNGLANLLHEFKPAVAGAGAKTYTTDRDILNVSPSDPSVEIGVSLVNKGAAATWTGTIPFGYTAAQASSIDRQNLIADQGYLVASDGTKQVIAAQGAAWGTTASLTLTPAQTAYIFQLYLKNTRTTPYPARAAINIATITFTLSTVTNSDSFGVPYVSLGAEQAVETDLDFVLSNLTTGESIRIVYPDVAVGQTLRINCLTNTATYLKNNANAYSAVQDYPARNNFLRDRPGSNTYSISVAGFTIVKKWQGRQNSIA